MVFTESTVDFGHPGADGQDAHSADSGSDGGRVQFARSRLLSQRSNVANIVEVEDLLDENEQLCDRMRELENHNQELQRTLHRMNTREHLGHSQNLSDHSRSPTQTPRTSLTKSDTARPQLRKQATFADSNQHLLEQQLAQLRAALDEALDEADAARHEADKLRHELKDALMREEELVVHGQSLRARLHSDRHSGEEHEFLRNPASSWAQETMSQMDSWKLPANLSSKVSSEEESSDSDGESTGEAVYERPRAALGHGAAAGLERRRSLGSVDTVLQLACSGGGTGGAPSPPTSATGSVDDDGGELRFQHLKSALDCAELPDASLELPARSGRRGSENNLAGELAEVAAGFEKSGSFDMQQTIRSLGSAISRGSLASSTLSASRSRSTSPLTSCSRSRSPREPPVEVAPGGSASSPRRSVSPRMQPTASHGLLQVPLRSPRAPPSPRNLAASAGEMRVTASAGAMRLTASADAMRLVASGGARQRLESDGLPSFLKQPRSPRAPPSPRAAARAAAAAAAAQGLYTAEQARAMAQAQVMANYQHLVRQRDDALAQLHQEKELTRRLKMELQVKKVQNAVTGFFQKATGGAAADPPPSALAPSAPAPSAPAPAAPVPPLALGTLRPPDAPAAAQPMVTAIARPVVAGDGAKLLQRATAVARPLDKGAAAPTVFARSLGPAEAAAAPQSAGTGFFAVAAAAGRAAGLGAGASAAAAAPGAMTAARPAAAAEATTASFADRVIASGGSAGPALVQASHQGLAPTPEQAAREKAEVRSLHWPSELEEEPSEAPGRPPRQRGPLFPSVSDAACYAQFYFEQQGLQHGPQQQGLQQHRLQQQRLHDHAEARPLVLQRAAAAHDGGIVPTAIAAAAEGHTDQRLAAKLAHMLEQKEELQQQLFQERAWRQRLQAQLSAKGEAGAGGGGANPWWKRGFACTAPRTLD